MLIRSLLHGVSTGAAVLAMHFAHDAPMWAQMSLYGAAWVGSAALYVPILYLREHVVEVMDGRASRILRAELERRDLAAFKRRLDREGKHDRAPHDDDA